MIGRLVRNVLAFAFVLGVAASAALMVAILKYRLELRRVESRYGAPEVGRQSASFVGFSADATRIELLSGDRGVAVWYASRDCPYCKRDEEWTALAGFLQDKGVRVVVLLPGRSQQFAPEQLRPKGAAQAVFVAPEWLSQFPLSLTPTLLIFDRDQQLVWYKRGMLTAQDSAAAVHVVENSLRRLR